MVFIETGPEKEVTTLAVKIAEAEKGPATVKVKVVSPFRVVFEGKPYVGGDVLELPQDDETSKWLSSSWVELVPEKGKK